MTTQTQLTYKVEEWVGVWIFRVFYKGGELYKSFSTYRTEQDADTAAKEFVRSLEKTLL